MFKSIFRLAYRNLLKDKTYTIINIIGLSLAMAATIVIFNYVAYEKSYDEFHAQKKNIYRVTSLFNKGKGNEKHTALTVAWTGTGAKSIIPEIADFARVAPASKFIGKKTIRYNNTKIGESRIMLADSSFLKMFSFSLVRGSAETALKEPFSMILTESLAIKYFGSVDAIMNKTVELPTKGNFGQDAFRITGIIKDPPPNSHMQFDVLLSFNTLYDYIHTGDLTFGWLYTYTYLQLNEGADPVAVAKKMTAARDSLYQNDTYKEYIDFGVQPLTGIHLDSDLKDEWQRNNNRAFINLLMIIGLFILILAYINYINIALAKSFERAREIGVRKTFGARRLQLIAQFIGEALFVNLVSVSLAILFSLVIIPLLPQLIGISQTFDISQALGVILLVLGFVLIGTFVSGAYPAFVLSSVKPVEALKEKISRLPGLTLRKILVVGQFTAGILLLSGTFAVYKQLKFMKQLTLALILLIHS